MLRSPYPNLWTKEILFVPKGYIARLIYTGDSYSRHMITGDGIRPRTWEEAGR